MGMLLTSVDIVSSVGDVCDFSNMVGRVGSNWGIGLAAFLDVPRGELPVLPNPFVPLVECGRRLTSLMLGWTTGVNTS